LLICAWGLGAGLRKFLRVRPSKIEFESHISSISLHMLSTDYTDGWKIVKILSEIENKNKFEPTIYQIIITH